MRASLFGVTPVAGKRWGESSRQTFVQLTGRLGDCCSGSLLGRRPCAAASGRLAIVRNIGNMMEPAKRAKIETDALAADTAGPAAAELAQDVGATGQVQHKKRKAVVMPTPVQPPQLPEDPTAWENAMLLIDKPKGWTSFDVCGKLRGALGGLLRKKPRDIKVGHAGTLDPMATGLLIVCVGKGTKAVDSFMAMHKEYSGTLKLGEGTDSYDAEGEVTQRRPWEHVTQEALVAAAAALTGDIKQLPPMHSAIRVGGKRLYEVARKGGEVERSPRDVTVDVFKVERDAADPQLVHFQVGCSKGTYIRSLAFDLGQALDSAAHLTALRRDAIGEHHVRNAWQMEDLVQQITEKRHAAAAARQTAVADGSTEAAADGKAAT